MFLKVLGAEKPKVKGLASGKVFYIIPWWEAKEQRSKHTFTRDWRGSGVGSSGPTPMITNPLVKMTLICSCGRALMTSSLSHPSTLLRWELSFQHMNFENISNHKTCVRDLIAERISSVRIHTREHSGCGPLKTCGSQKSTRVHHNHLSPSAV